MFENVNALFEKEPERKMLYHNWEFMKKQIALKRKSQLVYFMSQYVNEHLTAFTDSSDVVFDTEELAHQLEAHTNAKTDFDSGTYLLNIVKPFMDWLESGAIYGDSMLDVDGDLNLWLQDAYQSYGRIQVLNDMLVVINNNVMATMLEGDNYLPLGDSNDCQ